MLFCLRSEIDESNLFWHGPFVLLTVDGLDDENVDADDDHEGVDNVKEQQLQKHLDV